MEDVHCSWVSVSDCPNRSITNADFCTLDFWRGLNSSPSNGTVSSSMPYGCPLLAKVSCVALSPLELALAKHADSCETTPWISNVLLVNWSFREASTILILTTPVH